MVCFRVSVEILSADNWVCVFILLVIWVRRCALGETGSRVVLALCTDGGLPGRSYWYSLGSRVLQQPRVLD